MWDFLREPSCPSGKWLTLFDCNDFQIKRNFLKFINKLVSGLDNSAIFSGEPFINKSNESLSSIRTITLDL